MLDAAAAPLGPNVVMSVSASPSPTASETTGPIDERPGRDEATRALEKTPIAVKPSAPGRSHRNGATEAWNSGPNTTGSSGGPTAAATITPPSVTRAAERNARSTRSICTRGTASCDERHQGDRSRRGEIEQHLRRVDRDRIGAERGLGGDETHQYLIETKVEEARQTADPRTSSEGDRFTKQRGARSVEADRAGRVGEHPYRPHRLSDRPAQPRGDHREPPSGPRGRE